MRAPVPRGHAVAAQSKAASDGESVRKYRGGTMEFQRGYHIIWVAVAQRMPCASGVRIRYPVKVKGALLIAACRRVQLAGSPADPLICDGSGIKALIHMPTYAPACLMSY